MNKNTKKMILTIILSILVLIVSQILSQLIASIFLILKTEVFICNIIASILYIVICYYLLKILCNKYLKTDMENYNIPKFKLKLKWIIVAILLPIIVTGIYLLMDGTFHKTNVSLVDTLSIISVGVFFNGLSAGIVEEMVFRGMIMNSIEERYNKKIAILIPSILFGIVHILGMNFNNLSCLLVLISGTLVGIMFSLIAMTEKSIWNSAIVHVLWNIIIIGGIFSIGTMINDQSIYSYVLNTNSFIITGGEFGIESSIISASAYILVSLFTIYSINKKRKTG